jgi:hypothetical protein
MTWNAFVYLSVKFILPILSSLITLTILNEEYKLWSSFIMSFSFTYYQMFSSTHPQSSLLRVRDQISHPYKPAGKTIYGTRWRWWASCPSHFTPWEKPVIHWTGGWVGPRAGLDVVVKRKIRSPCWGTIFPNSKEESQASIIITYNGEEMSSSKCRLN